MIRAEILRLASRLSASSGLSTLAERWHSRRGGVILAYHEIPGPVLASHLEVIGRMYRFVPLGEYLDRLVAGRATSGLAVITFDDGPAEVIEAAAEISEASGTPMTFYLPTRFLDTGEPYWFQELSPLMRRAPSGRLEIDGMKLHFSDPALFEGARERLGGLFRRAGSAGELEELLRRVRRALTGSEERPPGLEVPLAPTWDRVAELARRPELDFQSHSVNHLALGRLGEAEIEREMSESRRRIEEATGRRVDHFCYPYGGLAEIGDLAPVVARRLFRSGVTMSRGRCRAGLDTALLPRVPLYDSDTVEMVKLKLALAR